MSFMSNVIASGAHGHVYGLESMFFRCDMSLRALMGVVSDVEGDPEGGTEKIPHVFEIKDQLLSYTRNPEVHSRESVGKGLFHSSVTEKTNHL